MNNPTVSVVLPTYNRASVLARSIYSVLNQTYTDFEIVVVDDCSNDSTIEVIAAISDPKLRLIQLAKNSGPSAARNAGIAVSTGKYIAFQDSDDEWMADKLEKQVNAVEAAIAHGSRVAACYTRYRKIGNRKSEVVPPVRHDTGRSLQEELHYGNKIGTPTLLVTRVALDTVGYFDEKLAGLEDWDLALRIAAQYDVLMIDEVMVNAYDSPGSVNKSFSPDVGRAILDKNQATFAQWPEALAENTWWLGYQYALARNKKEALRFMEISLNYSATLKKRALFRIVQICLRPYLMYVGMRSRIAG